MRLLVRHTAQKGRPCRGAAYRPLGAPGCSVLVEVTHTFKVEDEVTDDQIEYIVGTMTVQIEEAVVGHDDRRKPVGARGG